MNLGSAQSRIIAALIAVHVVFLATALIERPKVDSDASAGMLVLRSMERGARWNCAIEPDPGNIAHDRQEFLTWWSPGQYLAVFPLHRLGASWGVAIAATTFLCSLCGIFGYWWLYRGLGFSEATSAWATAALAVTWHVTRDYGEFPGGELPLFAVSPWLVGGITRLRPLGLRSLLPFAAIYLFGAMTKLSFCVTAAAALAGVACVDFFSAPGGRRLASIAAWAAGMVLAGHALVWLVFLRHGANPGGLGAHGEPWWYVLPAVLILPVGSVLGLGSLLSRLFLFPGHALLASQTSLAPVLWILVPVAAVAYWALAERAPLPGGYRLMLAGMAGTYVAVLGTLIVAGAPISLEDRQFFPVGAMILPAIVELARSGSARVWRVAARAGLMLACAYGLVAFVVHARQQSRTANVGRSGITQHIISREAMSVLHALDDRDPTATAGTLIYVPSPEISFELQRVRVMSTSDLMAFPEDLRRRSLHGRVPLLVVLSNPVLEAGGRDEIVRRSFADYSPSSWKQQRVGEWTFYYQGDWPLEAEAGPR